MKNIKFIEEHIEKCKEFINNYQNIIKSDEIIEKFSEEKILEFQERMQDTIMQQLKQFEEIKYILEAWEVVKEEAKKIEVVTTFKNPNYAKETTQTLGNYEIVEIIINIVGQDKIKTFKKALEVENE